MESFNNWYAVYTKHQHEKTAARILASKEVQVFLPLYSSVHNWKDRAKLISLPLFPCYIFLRTGLDRRLDIVTTPGIHAIVSSAGRPSIIPEPEIQAIRRAVESGASIEPHPLLQAGDRVRVRSGPLTGIEGILIRKKNLYRLVLSIEMLGKAASVEIDTSLIHRVDRTASNAGRLHRGTMPQMPCEASYHSAYGSF